jgi:hypothetical protein
MTMRGEVVKSWDGESWDGERRQWDPGLGAETEAVSGGAGLGAGSGQRRNSHITRLATALASRQVVSGK